MTESHPGLPGIPQSPQPQDETDLHKLAPSRIPIQLCQNRRRA